MRRTDNDRTQPPVAAVGSVHPQQATACDHKHCGSVHAPDAKMALGNARDVYTRRMEGVSIWVVRADAIIVASDPDAKPEMFDPAEDKIYRHPTFYTLPDEVNHM